jgi:protein-S-isoprenylcysteine O-methyltransferase Ste14
MVALYILKLHFEEQMLMRELAGYQEYEQHVRYRLLPHTLVRGTRSEKWVW